MFSPHKYVVPETHRMSKNPGDHVTYAGFPDKGTEWGGNVPGFATCILTEKLVTLGKSLESPKSHFFSCELGPVMLAS